ncbi:DegT/DnrJ/EryC1/StrS family aminotransferase [Paraburkholderia sediminicola]|uniref:DegT/DnrJ/EryC1/StrS family aminotransferase n=1 Tax=Paraburkholderia sediminicola TaxID=458836 RepID=UPI0038B86B40
MARFKVPRYDYAAQFSGIETTVLEKIGTALKDGRYILTEEVALCERMMAEHFGHRYVVGVNSGTDALVLALMALGVKAGDEVIVPANTFHATALAVALVGATPRLIDVDEGSFLTNPETIVEAVTCATKAIIFVHLYGKCVSLSGIAPLLKARGIALIEDAAQAHGSVAADGFRPGHFTDAVCYSFHPSKNLAAAGDAGAVATDRSDLDDSLRMLRTFGQRGQNVHLRIGINSKLDALQAIILGAKLPSLAKWNSRRQELARSYRGRLGGLPVQFQRSDEGESHTYHLFQVRTPNRDSLARYLGEAGIDAVVRYPSPLHLQPAFGYLGYSRGDFPVSETLADELLALPLFPSMTDEDIEYVSSKIQQYFETGVH